MAIDIRIPLGPFRDALSSTLGAIIGVVFVSLAGGFSLTIFSDWMRHGFSFDGMTFENVVSGFFWASIAQWIIACFYVWGIPFALLQAATVYEIVFGSRDTRFILLLALFNQLLVSTVALATFWDIYKWYQPLIPGVISLSVVGWLLWGLHSKGYSRATI